MIRTRAVINEPNVLGISARRAEFENREMYGQLL